MEYNQYRIGKKAAFTILIILSLLQLIDWADRSILAISLQYIKEEFRLTDTQAGLLPSLLQFGIAIFAIPSAILADRWARRKIIPIMDIVWSIFTLVTGLASHLWQFLLARFMVGAGEAGYAPAGQTWLGVIFPKTARSRIMGIFTMCNPLGIATGLMVGGILIHLTQNWRLPFYFFGFIGLFLAIMVFIMPDYKTVQQLGTSSSNRTFFREWRDLFKIKTYVFNLLGAIFVFFGAFAVPSWTPTILMRAYGLGIGRIGVILGLLGVLHLVSPLGGHLADKWQSRDACGRLKFILVVTLPIILVGGVVWTTVGIIPFKYWIVIYGLLTTLSAFMQPVVLTIVHDVTPVKVRTTGLATQLFFAQILGGALSPVVVGSISDALGGGTWGLKGGLLTTTAVSGFALITLLINMKYYPSDSARVSDAVFSEKY